MKRKIIRVSWEQREFHEFGCVGDSDMKSPLRLALSNPILKGIFLT
jgi:hypothetical protein